MRITLQGVPELMQRKKLGLFLTSSLDIGTEIEALLINDASQTYSKSAVLTYRRASDLSKIRDHSYMIPFGAERWLVMVDNPGLINNAFLKIVEESETMLFICIADNYRDYVVHTKTSQLKKYMVMDSFSYLSRDDVHYLYRKYVRDTSKYKLSPKLLNWVASRYANQSDVILTLFKTGLAATEYKKQSEIIADFGYPSSSYSNFLFRILKGRTPTDRGTQTKINGLIREANGMVGKIKPDTFRQGLLRNVVAAKDIYILMARGDVGTTLNNFDLSSYENGSTMLAIQRYMPEIKALNFNSLLRLEYELSRKRWVSDTDVITFFYTVFDKGGM